MNVKGKPKDNLNESGVYKLSCQCGKTYIGQTGRKIRTRVNEHLSHARLGRKGHSSFADHLIISKHKASEYEVKVQVTCSKGRRLNLLEQVEIEKYKGENLLNDQMESQVTPLTIPPTLLNFLKIDEFSRHNFTPNNNNTGNSSTNQHNPQNRYQLRPRTRT